MTFPPEGWRSERRQPFTPPGPSEGGCANLWTNGGPGHANAPPAARAWGWPPADLTLEQDLIDLGWHQKEFQRRSSFDYAVMSPDETRLLGCVYIDPSEKAGHDAEVWLRVRVSELDSGLDAELYATVRRWVEERWPFRRVAYPGRELPLDRYRALPDR